ncbi:MAG: hypothetical protein ABI467_07875 [Kofleriaceae bacterium]
MKALLFLVLVAGSARAGDSYCDYVQGRATATAATQFAPQLIGVFGYVEQAPSQVTPSQSSTLRFIGGINYRLTGIYEGFATRDHADADCRRHTALGRVRGETAARALAAKAKVLDDALVEADQIFKAVEADFEARRTTAQEATALRLRVEDLRDLAADTHHQLAALPPVTEQPLGAALSAYHHADADMEEAEAKLRKAQLVDVSVRAGVDEFLDANVTNPTPYFAVINVAVSLGALWQGRGNDRAAAARKQLVESGQDPLGADATLEDVQGTIDLETRRAEQTTALVAELERQLAALDKVGGEDSKRYRQTIWFDAAKARAEQAYLTAHLAALHEVLGGSP